METAAEEGDRDSREQILGGKERQIERREERYRQEHGLGELTAQREREREREKRVCICVREGGRAWDNTGKPAIDT